MVSSGDSVRPPCFRTLQGVAYIADKRLSIPSVDTMTDFRTAANILGRQITTSEMAEALELSPHSIRQARLQEGAPGYRRPPERWREALLRLAEHRQAELADLIAQLRSAG